LSTFIVYPEQKGGKMLEKITSSWKQCLQQPDQMTYSSSNS
jgi:hypothetical protein